MLNVPTLHSDMVYVVQPSEVGFPSGQGGCDDQAAVGLDGVVDGMGVDGCTESGHGRVSAVLGSADYMVCGW